MGFYALPLGEEIGFQDAWITFAFIIIAFSLPVLLLLFKGEQWSRALGPPTFDRDL